MPVACAVLVCVGWYWHVKVSIVKSSYLYLNGVYIYRHWHTTDSTASAAVCPNYRISHQRLGSHCFGATAALQAFPVVTATNGASVRVCVREGACLCMRVILGSYSRRNQDHSSQSLGKARTRNFSFSFFILAVSAAAAAVYLYHTARLRHCGSHVTTAAVTVTSSVSVRECAILNTTSSTIPTHTSSEFQKHPRSAAAAVHNTS